MTPVGGATVGARNGAAAPPRGGPDPGRGSQATAPETETEPAAAARDEAPFYVPVADEVALFEAAHRDRLPVLLQGPTGCGKTRFVQHMAWRLARPLVTVACHDDLSASDLVGRYLVRGAETVWQDGPLARAARVGALCYLDELVEARPDTIVVLHPLADDRRLLPIDKTGELLAAHPDFHLVASYNPGYQGVLKELKPSTRQRFVTIALGIPPEEVEARVVEVEARLDAGTARRLVRLGRHVRNLRDRGLVELPSTRLLVQTGKLIAAGIDPRRACRAALVGPLSDDPELVGVLDEVVRATLG